MFKFVVIGLVVFGLLASLSFFHMYQQADRVNQRIEREALGLFDVRAGVDSIRDAVEKIAREEKVTFINDGLKCEIVASTRARVSNMAGLAQPNSGTEAAVVTSTFKCKRFCFFWTYTRIAKRTLFGSNDRAPSQRSTGQGFRPGVNLPGPGRDINSHRKTINRAAQGQMP